MITINKNHIHIDDSIKSYSHTELQNSSMEDKDSWIFHISETLSNPPEYWNELKKENKCYTIIKNEFEKLTKNKSQLEINPNSDDKEYKENLIHLASACINALMN